MQDDNISRRRRGSNGSGVLVEGKSTNRGEGAPLSADRAKLCTPTQNKKGGRNTKEKTEPPSRKTALRLEEIKYKNIWHKQNFLGNHPNPMQCHWWHRSEVSYEHLGLGVGSPHLNIRLIAVLPLHMGSWVFLFGCAILQPQHLEQHSPCRAGGQTWSC